MKDVTNLTNKTILVTGASSGIGKQIASTLSEAGAVLVITGRNEQRLNETLNSLTGERHQAVACDLTSLEGRERLVANLPKLNGVVHCAGVIDIKPIKYIEKSDIHTMNTTNYQAPVLLTQLLLFEKKLQKQASLVFITSVSAHLGAIGFGLYAASKGALTSFARVLALETSSQGIRVNCLAAGMVKTPMFDETASVLTEEALAENEKLYPLGFVSPTDVANGVLYLLSDISQKVTGITLTIDGGYSIA
jgi:NAD(P)-dependent dehydrogenase (short-subunit alcohol dehydrogenase family)